VDQPLKASTVRRGLDASRLGWPCHCHARGRYAGGAVPDFAKTGQSITTA
jgi:hypothetical protein